VTAALNPYSDVRLIAVDPEAPLATDIEDGFALTEKPGEGGGIVFKAQGVSILS